MIKLLMLIFRLLTVACFFIAGITFLIEGDVKFGLMFIGVAILLEDTGG